MKSCVLPESHGKPNDAFVPMPAAYCPLPRWLHAPFAIPHSPFTNLSVPRYDTRRKTVLAKRTHLKLVHQKRKYGFVLRDSARTKRTHRENANPFGYKDLRIVTGMAKPNQSQFRDGFRGSIVNPEE